MSSKPIEAFRWYTDKPRGISVTTEEGITSVEIAYMVRGDDLNTRYLQLSNRSQRLVIRLSDLIKRVDISTSEETLKKDLQAKWFQCPLWHQNGNRVTQQELTQPTRKIPIVNCLINPTSQNSTRYGTLWATYFNEATKEAEAQLYISHKIGGYDVLNRFFVPDLGTTFKLGFLPRPGFDIKRQDFQTIKQNFEDGLGVNPIILKFTSEEAAKAKGWVKFSENPLSLYTTWVEKSSRDDLEFAQAGEQGWQRPIPTLRQATAFNTKLLAKSRSIGKVDSIRPITIASLPRWRGESLSSYRRRVTETFMGESANKWAKQTLGWTGKTGKSVVAEWLHRIAHRFEKNTGDRYNNMIFGTRECNTDMMRAEATVTQLLSSDKIHQLLVETRSECAYKLGTMRYTRWATKKLEYTIKFQILNSKRSVFMWKTDFFPFSRRYPFRFEYELDKIILERVLSGLDAPRDPARKASSDILAPYNDTGDQGWDDQPVLCRDSSTWAGDASDDDDDDDKDPNFLPGEGEGEEAYEYHSD
ncbi:hypothetical protein FRC07_006671 [Ceratobasidium sp. 392]|nr:hypothetical protein FRC07_006671 [Ceratobasidium sp. 392]